jgi:uncharacterized protein YPO0396
MTNNIAPSKWNGFRIKTIEVRNFGGYHRSTTRFFLNSDGVVFSGPNGAGKSTALDALRLIFRERPSFNSASAESSSGRNIESYYVGQYASTGRGTRTSKKDAQTLRGVGDEANTMGILVVFENPVGECFTAGRMLYIRANGNREWQNFTSPSELSLDEHFPTWKTAGKVARQLSELGGMLHKTIDDYLVALGESFGFTNQRHALDAFHNFEAAIGVKDMKSVNGFAQDYLLPADNFSKAVDNAVEQIEASYQALREAEETEKQIKMLTDLEAKMKEYKTAGSDILRADDLLDLAALTRKIINRFMQKSVRAAQRNKLSILNGQHAAVQAEILNLEAEKESLDAALNSDEARQADMLRGEQAANTTNIGNRENRLTRMAAIAQSLSVTLDASSEVKWNDVHTKVTAMVAEAEAAAETLRSQKSEHDFKLHEKNAEIQSIKEEIKTLDESGSNLHAHSLRARTAISQAIGVNEEDMPFVCELVRIRKSDEAWEGVANRVLDGVGRQMLVAPDLYGDAVSALNAGKWGGKVVICDTTRNHSSSCSALPSDTLASKLEIKDHRYAGIVDSLLHDNADHRCVNAAQLKTIKGKAVTQEGTIKLQNRAEKNDKNKINDRRNYILAWDTTARKQGLEEVLEELTVEQTSLNDISVQYNAGISKHSERAHNAHQLLGGHEGWADYSNIETASLVTRNKQIKAELANLETGETAALFKRREEVKLRLPIARKENEGMLVQKGSIEGTIESLTATIKDKASKKENRLILETIARRSEKLPFGLEDRRLFRSMLLEETADGPVGLHFAHAPITALATKDYSAMERACNGVELKLRKSRDRISNDATVTVGRMQNLVTRYIGNWPEAGAKLETTITKDDGKDVNYTVFDEWMAALDQKRHDDLPRVMQTLKEEQSDAIEQHITTICSEIESYDERVDEMIDSINALLANIPYDPAHNTRAALQYLETEDEEINTFRARFKAISDTAHNKKRSEITQDMRDLLLPLVDDSSADNQRRRKKILSLAKWKDVYVEELGIEADGELKLRRSFMGKDGASGGQRERLTMLMLGAAQTYGMGGADPSRTATGLQTIVLDEAFLRSSSETAQASTDILSAMGLQVIAATPFEKLGAFRGQASQIITVTSVENQVKTQPTQYQDMFGALPSNVTFEHEEEEIAT